MRTTVRVIVSILIFVLAAASVANIHERAVQLHTATGWQTWAVSGGFAVTFALFAYLLVSAKSNGSKVFFFFCAIFGAALTSTMQYGLYVHIGADTMTALAFGCGGPVLEALLAISEHFLDSNTERKTQPQNAIWGRLSNAVAARIEQSIAPALSPVAVGVAPIVVENTSKLTSESSDEQSEIDKMNEARKRKVADRQTAILHILTSKTPTVSELATEVKSSDNTIRNDLKALQVSGHNITVNGVVKLN